MQLLYLGYAVNRNLEKQIKGISVAGNKMQVNLLKALVTKIGDALRAISVYPMAAYPTGSDLVISQRCETVLSEPELKTHIPFILNIPFVKNIFEMFSTYRLAKKLYKEKPFDKIIMFNAFPATAWAGLRLKKKYGCELICLLADLPIDDSIHTTGLKKYLRNRLDAYTKMAIRQMDKLIVLNKEAAHLYAPDVPYMVMEGAVDSEDVKPFAYKTAQRKNVLFTGSLQKYNGIVELIGAAKLLKDSDVEFDIYGKGEYQQYVEEAAQKYAHIHYGGLCSNDKIMKIQQESFLLINPRPVDDFIAKVTFPSKMFEYMTSGTPVLTTRLNGFLEEYYDTMFFIDDNSPQSIADAIVEVVKTNEQELSEKALLAYNLVTQKKNWDVQTSNIIGFISE